MLAICANTSVNIIAAQGHDADGALYGLSGISRPRSPIRQCTRRQEEFVLTASWHQKDRSHWQRQLGQYIASNSGRQFVLLKVRTCSAWNPQSREPERRNFRKASFQETGHP